MNPRYFEDLQTGDEFETAARTIGEADIIAFATLTGDMNPLHTDAEFAKSTPYGGRIAHGMLSLSYAIGLLDRSGLFSGTAIANLGIREWRFEKPVFPGDTIRVRLRIGALRRTSDGKRGIVERELAILNQRGETVSRGKSDVMLRAREEI
ncbi:MAG: MaoC family dehydratase N-terminal domain-containing protein, partial [Candidatus Eremiobacteraeota bacterium]|nr:MaoC family dehydratase N-terminal domain-containing protein [Candidatus Eremiobacteraeota bacterium]